MAVLEAWSYGLPVLMSDACNLPEGFSHNAAARLALDPHGMTFDLSRFLKLSRAQLSDMGGNGRRLVAEQFSWPGVAQRFVSIYDWLIDGGAQPESIFAIKEKNDAPRHL